MSNRADAVKRAERMPDDAPTEHRGEDPERASDADGTGARAPAAAPKQPTHERDQGFNESHGYSPGHGGPTGPGDAPAKDADDAHDASRRSRPDSHPDSR